MKPSPTAASSPQYPGFQCPREDGVGYGRGGQARAAIDHYGALLPAANANGYAAKYGEAVARRAIADGIAYAAPRAAPESQNPTKPRLRWSGGRWVKAVRA